MGKVIQPTCLKSRLHLIILLALASLFATEIHCQNLINSRTTSYNTYIYSITNDEAERIYKDGDEKIDSTIFHTLVDSCPTDSIYKRVLAPGHYIKIYSEKNRQKCYLLSVPELDVFVLNNYTDLCIRVCDQTGGIVNDARVIIGSKTLKFDSQTQLYKDKKSGRKGILKVSWKGTTTFYDIVKEYGHSGIVRIGLKILWRSPVKYIWIPVNYVGRLPYDGIKSLVHHYPHRSISSTIYFFNKAYSNIACLLSGYHCNEYSKNYNKGYFVFNKPKYRPEDTVRFKAFVLDRKGRALNKKVAVILEVNNKSVKLTELVPYTKGGYEYGFPLCDSFNLRLDREYSVSLQNTKTDKVYSEGSFSYEDYELAKNELLVRTDGDTHFKGQNFSLFIKGVDENELDIMDGRVQLLAKPLRVKEYLRDLVYVPDTLFFFEKQLVAEGETEITIIDSAFPPANFAYEIIIQLLTSENESVIKTITVDYSGEEENFQIEAINDSLKFNLVKNGTSVNRSLIISGVDIESKKVKLYEGKNPATIPLNPFFDHFVVQSGDIIDYYFLPEEESLLQCFKRRTHDSLFIYMNNPRKIPFTYELYRKNIRVAGGYSDTLNYKEKVTSVKNYLISLRYLWGGEVVEEKYQIPYFDKMLQIEVDQPDLVFPGQKTKIDLLVKDMKGRPVKNVDLTAFSITKKFNSPIPKVPYLGKQRKLKPYLNKYSKTTMDESTNHLDLNYEAWATFAGIDSIEYYKFIYPGNQLYRFEYNTPDSITQLAPFVVNNGKSLPVHIIYIDSKPVYFSWSSNNPPYSFKANPGYHHVILRTSHHIITIDSLYMRDGKKLIISMDVNIKQKNIHIEETEPTLSQIEKNVLYPYVLPYRNTFDDQIAYIEDAGNYQLISIDNNKWSTMFAGPFTGNLKFNILNGSSFNFDNEPGFEYEFGDHLLKMRTFERSKYPVMLHNASSDIDNLKAYCLTKTRIEEMWQQQIDSKRSSFARFENPTSTSSGYGKMQLYYQENQYSDERPINILLLKNNDEEFIRVYPGKIELIHQLKQGYYKVILFFSGSRYHLTDSVFVNINGSTYCRIKMPDQLKKDEFSLKCSQLISNSIFNPFVGTNDSKRALNNLYSAYKGTYTFSGEGRIVSGYVYDEVTNEPIIGAVIGILNTNYGTITDINGHYSINVPKANDALFFNFIGYVTVIQKINSDNFLSIKLKHDNLDIEGVVVTSMAISRTKNSLSYAASEISGEELAEFPTVSYLASRVGGVMVKNLYPLPEISPDDDKEQDIKDERMQNLYSSSLNSGTIRKNFSDFAFWQPKLTTNKEGKASFEVTFPGDVTSWQTNYLAINDKRQSGQVNHTIRSYKPLMAQLAVPRFLIENDSTMLIGKVLNYLNDSSWVTTCFYENDELKSNTTRIYHTSLIDTLLVSATDDILSLSYTISKTDGFNDGETRNIPVLPAGLEETKGCFFILENDTSLKIGFQPTLGDVQLYATTDNIEVLEDEIKYLTNYKYQCNEQLASKLKALLAGKRIASYKKEDFKYEREIKKVINLISGNRKPNGYWGWWKDSEESEWISLHVLEALAEAQNLGYFVKHAPPMGILVRKFADSKDTDTKIRIVNMMYLAGSKVDYKEYLDQLVKLKNLSLNNLLQIIELRQKCRLPYNLDTVFRFQQNTMLGNIYFSDTISKQSLSSNDIQNTLLVYKILKGDSLTNNIVLNKIRNYFFESRRSRYWGNTYESSRIIETILPDMLTHDFQITQPKLKIEDPFSKQISDFPYVTTFKPSDSLKIVKTGSSPVYMTTYQRKWNADPKAKSTDFEIATRFKEQTSSILKGGKVVTLVAEVTVTKDADYVMINIPIPGGCSYGNKDKGSYPESHREYYKNETTIFCQHLHQGKYRFEVKLLPRFSGTYTLNPAKIELMYYPTFNANNGIKKVKIN